MKPILPQEPLDELIAAALHGEMTQEERAQFESRLQNDPAALAAYQETLLMHDLLEKTHRDAQPDAAFEERIVSGVRRKIQTEDRHETAWESLLFLWRWTKQNFSLSRKHPFTQLAFAGLILLIVSGVALGPITSSVKKARESAAFQQQGLVSSYAPNEAALTSPKQIVERELRLNEAEKKDDLQQQGFSAYAPTGTPPPDTDGAFAIGRTRQAEEENRLRSLQQGFAGSRPAAEYYTSNGQSMVRLPTSTARPLAIMSTSSLAPATSAPAAPSADSVSMPAPVFALNDSSTGAHAIADSSRVARDETGGLATVKAAADGIVVAPTASPETSLKLIRNAQLDLEVKSYQAAVDQIGALNQKASGYVDSSSSEKGGNGKLQGTVVVKIQPQNLDSFLIKLRDIGQVENQSVSTENVTKDYVDTQARLDNSRRMETQLQDLLKHENSKVSDLLQVERELARVRGNIEQMQGQLKLYDFEIQYATVTIQMKEKDLNQTAAYLLKEQDDFSLFAQDVEATFKKARSAADDFKAQVLQANLNHNSGSDVSADLVVMVAPDQIEPFLSDIRSLGRLANFTRQTQRVARDGGESDQPADQARTDKDDVQMHVAIRSDDESRKRAALTVVTLAVDDALDKAKTAALSDGGEILSSSLNKTPQGQATAELSVRVPGKGYQALLGAFRAFGRTSSFSLQRNDNSGPGADGDDAPVIVSLSLTDDETPLQETEMSVLVSDVDDRAQAIKRQAGAAGAQVKDSNFDRQPDGTETAQLRFLLPLSKYPAFLQSLKELGKVESLTVQRQDQPMEGSTDADAPVQVGLKIHNQGDVVPDNTGLWATIRETFGEGASALFGSVKTIGVAAAFLAPWIFTLGLLAWAGRRIYVGKKR
jgi:hypothetical protein